MKAEEVEDLRYTAEMLRQDLGEVLSDASTTGEEKHASVLDIIMRVNDSFRNRGLPSLHFPATIGQSQGVRFSPERYAELIERTFDKVRELGKLKGGEYSGDVDRLANFRRNGEAMGLPMDTVWAVYAGKHWDAIQQYIKDWRTGTERVRLEDIAGRADDLIVYLLLFKAMLEERDVVG